MKTCHVYTMKVRFSFVGNIQKENERTTGWDNNLSFHSEKHSFHFHFQF
mgnify:CR=1 FL=1